MVRMLQSSPPRACYSNSVRVAPIGPLLHETGSSVNMEHFLAHVGDNQRMILNFSEKWNGNIGFGVVISKHGYIWLNFVTISPPPSAVSYVVS